MDKLTENEMFMSLFLLAKEDVNFKAKLESILRESDVTRVALIENLVKNIKPKASNEDLLNALDALKSPSVAYKALKLLSQ